MIKEELKLLLEAYWYDNKYLEEKTKEIEKMSKIIENENFSNLAFDTKHYEETELTKILEKKKNIENLFHTLTQPYKTLMYMKYISFLTFDQIADRMNYSTKRIYQLHSEGINKLLHHINENELTFSTN